MCAVRVGVLGFLCLLGWILCERRDRNKEWLSSLAADNAAHLCSLGHQKLQTGRNDNAAMGFFWKMNDQIWFNSLKSDCTIKVDWGVEALIWNKTAAPLHFLLASLHFLVLRISSGLFWGRKNASLGDLFVTFLLLSFSLPNCDSLGEKDRKLTQAGFTRLEKFAKKHRAMGIAALEQESLLTVPRLENSVNI